MAHSHTERDFKGASVCIWHLPQVCINKPFVWTMVAYVQQLFSESAKIQRSALGAWSAASLNGLGCCKVQREHVHPAGKCPHCCLVPEPSRKKNMFGTNDFPTLSAFYFVSNLLILLKMLSLLNPFPVLGSQIWRVTSKWCFSLICHYCRLILKVQAFIRLLSPWKMGSSFLFQAEVLL